MKHKHLLIFLLLLLGSFYTVPSQAAPDIKPHIVGGQPSSRDQWPWIVALVSNDFGSLYDRQFCGGSLIAPNWVVTAAHCTYDSYIDLYDEEHFIKLKPKALNVVAGILDLATDTGQEIHVKRIIRHPAYNNITSENDIALLQLRKKVTYPGTGILHLYTGADTLADMDATAIGWGALSEVDSNNGEYPSYLSDVSLPIVSNEACLNAYQDFPDYVITEDMLCAGLAQGGKDTCQGDSGGPLVINDNGTWRLAGITSFGEGCALPGLYGVYTRVSSYVKFIKSRLKKDFPVQ